MAEKTGREPHVKELSGKIKNMKFMNRGNEARIRENLEQQQRLLDSQASWVLDSVDRTMLMGQAQVETENSYMSFIEVPSMVRRSFKSFNKEIEKLSGDAEREARLKRSEENEKREQITDAEMVTRFQDIRGSGKPAQGKRKRPASDDEAPKSSGKVNIESGPVDWSKERGRKATRFAAGKFIKPLD